MESIAIQILRRIATLQIFLNFFKKVLFSKFFDGREAAHAEGVVKKHNFYVLFSRVLFIFEENEAIGALGLQCGRSENQMHFKVLVCIHFF